MMLLSVQNGIARNRFRHPLSICGNLQINMEEIWKQIEGYNGTYYVSNTGCIKSSGKIGLNVLSGPHKRKDVILKPATTNWGYQRIVLQLNGVRKHERVHRLVAKYFIPNPNNKQEVNHIDGNKLNNRVDNLEWATPKENEAHAYKNGLKINKGLRGFQKINKQKTKTETMEKLKFTGNGQMQGDTQWFGIQEIPSNAKKIEKQFVAASEKSGSFHALFGTYDMYEHEDGFIIDAKEDCIINHSLKQVLEGTGVSLDEAKVLEKKDHRHSILPKGIHFVGIQQRFDPLAGIKKKVID